MIAFKLIALSSTVVALLGSSGSAPVPMTPDPPLGELTALALKISREHAAQSEFWREIALALNATSENPMELATEALADLEAETALAQEMLRARLEACALAGLGPYDPNIVPAAFNASITNAHFPLVPRRRMTYETVPNPNGRRTVSVVQEATVNVGGVACREVRTTSLEDDVVVEESKDWFAQHTGGTVWYFGELTLKYEEGFLVSMDGSWRAGKDGAKPGSIMPGSPFVGEVCRVAFVADEDEDLIKVISTNATATTQAGTYTNCVIIEEWSPLEPGELSQKYYAPGVGLVLEIDLITGERVELTEIVDN